MRSVLWIIALSLTANFVLDVRAGVPWTTELLITIIVIEVLGAAVATLTYFASSEYNCEEGRP